ELWGHGDPSRHIVLGFALPIRFPTGDASSLRGDDGFTFEPRLLALGQINRIRVTANIGAALRTQTPDNIAWGQEFTFGVAGGYDLSPDRLTVQLEALGGKHFSDGQGADFPLELWAGVNFFPGPNWSLFAGGGPGLTDGIGSPEFRIYGGV